MSPVVEGLVHDGQRLSSTLIGRGEELTDIEGFFRDGGRAMALVGPAGSGKSALARAFLERWPQGGERALFCDATTARTTAELCTAIARALDLRLPSVASVAELVERLGAILSTRAIELLVLDNLEQLEDEGRSAIAAWVARTPTSGWLLASRERLAPIDAHVLRVAPLSVPPRDVTDLATLAAHDAVQLFLQRARRVRPRYTLNEASAPLIAEIVRVLDGLPLSIELAAARMSVVGERQLLELLEYRLDLIEARDGRRSTTLRGVLEASWEALTPLERRALAWCSTFVGSFSLEAFGEVAVPRDEAPAVPTRAARAVELLTALHDKSLVLVGRASGIFGELRYGLLESVREYVGERLGAEGTGEAAAAHARYFARAASAWADAAHGPRGTEAALRLVDESDNVMAVHQRATSPEAPDRVPLELGAEALLALEDLFLTRGPVLVYVRALDTLLSYADGLPPPLRARVFASRGWSALYRSAPDEAIVWLDRALACAAPDDLRLRTFALLKSGAARAISRRFMEAHALFEEARALLARRPDTRLEAMCFLHVATARTHEGTDDDARACYEKAATLFREAGSRGDEAVALASVGMVCVEQGALVDARRCLGEAIAIVRELGHRTHESWLLTSLGVTARDEGLLDEARAHFDRGLVLAREGGARHYEGLLLAHLGDLAFQEDRLLDACRLYEQGATVLDEVGRPRARAMTLAAWAAVEARLGRVDEAKRRVAVAAAEPSCNRPGDRETVALFAGAVELACERLAGCPVGTEGPAERELRRLIDVASTRRGPDELRLAVRINKRALERPADGGVAPDAAPAAAGMVVAGDGAWFRMDGASKTDLGHRSPTKRVLCKLAEARVREPTRAVAPKELFEAGWPGERTSPVKLANRVKSAIRALRQLGLTGAIQTYRGGYRIDPRVDVRITDAPA